jgi:hypothetical protein
MTISSKLPPDRKVHFAPLQPLRYWLTHFKITTPQMARRIARWIPAQCPFERDIKIFGKVIAHIPPLCKLNPFYEEFIELRFRALCYLVDECGEDIAEFI